MASWKDDIEVIIPAVVSIPERADSLRNLLIALAQQCAGVRVRVLPQYHRPKDIARHTFEVLTDGLRDFSRPWIVYLEEDVRLNDDFGEHLSATLDLVDDDVGAISFFPVGPESVRYARENVHFYDAPRPFIYAQCLALRREVAEAWSRYLIPWQEQPGNNVDALDMALGDCCDSIGVRLLVHLPGLVKPLSIPSAFGHAVYSE